MSRPHQIPRVSGAIPRVEYQSTHSRFLWAVRPPVAMVGLVHAARIAMHDADFFPPETEVILTSTISDSKLAGYSFADELRLCRTLEPEWVLPFDFPVYGDMNPADRRDHIKQASQGARDMAYILSDLSPEEIDRVCTLRNLPRELVAPSQPLTTVLPLIKGTTPAERDISLSESERYSPPLIAKYGVQYMTVGGNGSYPALVSTLESISDHSDGRETLVIGLLSPSGQFSLEGVPDNIVAAAGTNQWVKRVQPRSNSPAQMRSAYETLANAVASTLDVSQSYNASIAAGTDDHPPTEFESSPGVTVGDDLSPTYSGAAGDGEYGFGKRKRPDDAMSASMAGHKGGQWSPTEDK